MKYKRGFTKSNFYIKLTNWEYWPFGILQFPVILYYAWLSLRARSFLFFTASNPGITMGGMFGESKFEVLQKISTRVVPKTFKVDLPTTAGDVLRRMKDEAFTFPVIFKPDLGERGFMVKRINNLADVERYLQKIRISFLVQELVDLPLEFGIFYVRHPSSTTGRVTSIVGKELLSVVGDGQSTLEELILSKPRAKLQLAKLREQYEQELHNVLPRGKKVELVSIGNHALGTKFLNANHLITDKLHRVFDNIARDIEGFYFGRFDLRCNSIEDLYEGKVFIVELNGCGAEPAHIYDPDFKFIDAVFVLLRHWKTIFEISMSNHQRGVPFTSFKEGKRHYRNFRNATR